MSGESSNSGSSSQEIQEAEPRRMIKKPPKMSTEEFLSKKGYLLNRAERETVVSVLSGINGTAVFYQGDPLPLPKTHPMYNKPLPFTVVKDNNGSMYSMYDKKLGEGGYATVYVAQNIYTQQPEILPGNYYALKVQKAGNEELRANVRNENAYAAEFKLTHGEVFDPARNNFYTVMPIIPGAELIKQSGLFGASKNDIPVEQPIIQVEAERDIELSSLSPSFKFETEEDTKSENKHEDPVKKEEDEKKSDESESNPDIFISGGFVVKEDEKEPEEPNPDIFISGGFVVNEDEKETEEPNPDIFISGGFVVNEDEKKPEIKPEIKPENVSPVDLKMFSNELIELPPNPNVDVNDFDVSNWIKIFESMAEQVEKTHEKGILHLDIKPHNIMYDPKSEKMTLFDFGLSKRLAENSQTPYEYGVGSPMFVAPEFFDENHKERLSTKQDIYSLGKTFECLLTPSIQELTAGQGVAFRTFSPAGPKATFGPFFYNFQLTNDNQVPQITAINSIASLARQMRDENVANRPEASVVRSTLEEIGNTLHKDLHEAQMAEHNKENKAKAIELLNSFIKELEDYAKEPSLAEQPNKGNVGKLLHRFESFENRGNTNIEKAKQLLIQLNLLHGRITRDPSISPEIILKKIHDMGNQGLLKPGGYTTTNAKKLNDICQRAIEGVSSHKAEVAHGMKKR